MTRVGKLMLSAVCNGGRSMVAQGAGPSRGRAGLQESGQPVLVLAGAGLQISCLPEKEAKASVLVLFHTPTQWLS